MKKYYTDSDIGCVLIGNEGFGYAVDNCYGDGTTSVYVFADEKEFDNSDVKAKVKFDTSCKGKFNIYSYDCADLNSDDIVATLEGRYAVYHGNRTVAFVKWE